MAIMLCEECGWLGPEEDAHDHAGEHVWDGSMPHYAGLGHHGEAEEGFMDDYIHYLSDHEYFDEWVEGVTMMLRGFCSEKYGKVRSELASWRATAEIYVYFDAFDALTRIRHTPMKAENFKTWEEVMGKETEEK